MQDARKVELETTPSSDTSEVVRSLVSGALAQQPLSEIPEAKRAALVRRLRRKDKPILATSDAHGPG